MNMSFPNGIQNVSADGGSFEIWAVKDAGFCFGVERAVKLAQEAAARFGKVYSLGPLIHNNEVVAMLASEGIHVAETLDEVKQELRDSQAAASNSTPRTQAARTSTSRRSTSRARARYG